MSVNETSTHAFIHTNFMNIIHTSGCVTQVLLDEPPSDSDVEKKQKKTKQTQLVQTRPGYSNI